MPGSALTRLQAAPPRGLPSSRSPAFDFSRAGPRLPASVGKAWEWAWRLGLRSPSLDTAGGFAGLCLALPLSDTVAPLTWGHGGAGPTGRASFEPNTAPQPAAARDPHAKEFRAYRVSLNMCSGAKAVPFPLEARWRGPFVPENWLPCRFQ